MRLYTRDKNREYVSFLECITSENVKVSDLNQRSIIEFLTFGCVYGEKTFFSRISKKTTHQPFRFNESGQQERAKYQIKNQLISSGRVRLNDARKLFLDFFQVRADWLSSKKISIDLTGGIDSRLITSVLLHCNIPFDAVFSLGSGSEQELEIVKNLADCANVNLKIITPAQTISSEEEIYELMRLGDGQWDPTGLISLKSTQQWREQQGYDLAITGVGGELYKDFWWQQDFPFYNSGNANIDRLLKMRMYPTDIPDAWLGDALQMTQDDYLKSFKTQLNTYSQSINTETYDQIYYHLRIKEQVSVFSHASSEYLPVWSPLLEPELLKIGYNLSRKDRFFNRFHRDVISFCAPQLSKIPTTDGGMSVSNRSSRIIRDFVTYGRTKSERLLLKLGAISEKQNKPEMTDTLLTNAVQQAIEILKQVKILSANAPVNPDQYPSGIRGRLILVGFLVEKIDSEKQYE